MIYSTTLLRASELDHCHKISAILIMYKENDYRLHLLELIIRQNYNICRHINSSLLYNADNLRYRSDDKKDKTFPSISPSMAGLYCDITLLASVGKETATNTISRQAILYSSSGLMFSAKRCVLLHIKHAFQHRQNVQILRMSEKGSTAYISFSFCVCLTTFL